MSASATLHCLTGCGIGELLGLIVSHALGWGTIASIALAVSLALVDNAIIFAIPGAASEGPLSPLFRGAFAVAMAGAFVAAFPVNRWLIARGRGHARVHQYH